MVIIAFLHRLRVKLAFVLVMTIGLTFQRRGLARKPLLFRPGLADAERVRRSGKPAVVAPTTRLHLRQRHPRPVHMKVEVTTAGSRNRREFSSKCLLPFE